MIQKASAHVIFLIFLLWLNNADFNFCCLEDTSLNDLYVYFPYRKSFACTDAPEEAYDPRCLYERLQEQKMKKDMEFDEAHKLSKIYQLKVLSMVV